MESLVALKLTCGAPGSKADFPKDLLAEVRKLEEIFTADTQKLKQITDHFVNELAKGMYCCAES